MALAQPVAHAAVFSWLTRSARGWKILGAWNRYAAIARALPLISGRQRAEPALSADVSIPLHSSQPSGEICVPLAEPVRADDPVGLLTNATLYFLTNGPACN